MLFLCFLEKGNCFNDNNVLHFSESFCSLLNPDSGVTKFVIFNLSFQNKKGVFMFDWEKRLKHSVSSIGIG